MKAYFNLIIKAVLVGLVLSLIILLADLTGIKHKLLQEKKVNTNVNEGEYILSRLTSRYEEFLRKRHQELEIEKQNLLSERLIQKNVEEREKIEKRLKEIENEKNLINEEVKKNLKEKADNEAKLQSLKTEQSASDKIISDMTLNYQKLLNEKNNLDSYWNKYVSDLKNYFINNYDKDPSKKPQIEDQFKNDNGKKYIFEEYNKIKP